MSLSPFDSFQSRFVTYLLNFPRTRRVHLILLYMVDMFMFRSDLAVKQLVCHPIIIQKR